MRLLVVGDSFSADWSYKYPNSSGWPNLLAEKFTVTNLSQAGCSEFRILKQLRSTSLSQFDCVLISHTSPYRIYTEYNPLRAGDQLHHHCDLLYSDVKALAKTNQDYAAAATYFEKFFSLEFADYNHQCVYKDIVAHTKSTKTVHITHIANQFAVDIDFSTTYQRHSGLINHYSKAGNLLVFETVYKYLLL